MEEPNLQQFATWIANVRHAQAGPGCLNLIRASGPIEAPSHLLQLLRQNCLKSLPQDG